MESAEVGRAVSAALGVAAAHGLPADGAVVLNNSNRLTCRLTPGRVLARVAHADQAPAQLIELQRARRFGEAGCPVGAVEPSVDPLIYLQDGFAVTLWVYYETTEPEIEPVEYAVALARLHVGLRAVEMTSPHYTERILEAEQVANDPDLSPELTDTDRSLLGSTLQRLRRSTEADQAPEQLLHGEPHPGNLLHARSGPLFVDLETVCRGPVEFDLAHAPPAVATCYPEVNEPLLDDCRGLVLAMLAAWRWRRGDEFPDRIRWGQQFLRSLRSGPPWPSLEMLTRQLADPSERPSS